MKTIGNASRILATLALCATSAAAATQETADPVRGKALYSKHGCYGCHGYNGETGARDLVATGSPLIADLSTFRAFLRLRGDVAPLLPSARMPNYPASSLGDQDVADIYAFVKTFRLNAPAISTVPTLEGILRSARTVSPKN